MLEGGAGLAESASPRLLLLEALEFFPVAALDSQSYSYFDMHYNQCSAI